MKSRYANSLLGTVVAIVLVIVGKALFKQMSLPLVLTVAAMMVGIGILLKRQNPRRPRIPKAPTKSSEDGENTGPDSGCGIGRLPSRRGTDLFLHRGDGAAAGNPGRGEACVHPALGLEYGSGRFCSISFRYCQTSKFLIGSPTAPNSREIPAPAASS